MSRYIRNWSYKLNLNYFRSFLDSPIIYYFITITCKTNGIPISLNWTFVPNIGPPTHQHVSIVITCMLAFSSKASIFRLPKEFWRLPIKKQTWVLRPGPRGNTGTTWKWDSPLPILQAPPAAKCLNGFIHKYSVYTITHTGSLAQQRTAYRNWRGAGP